MSHLSPREPALSEATVAPFCDHDIVVGPLIRMETMEAPILNQMEPPISNLEPTWSGRQPQVGANNTSTTPGQQQAPKQVRPSRCQQEQANKLGCLSGSDDQIELLIVRCGGQVGFKHAAQHLCTVAANFNSTIGDVMVSTHCTHGQSNAKQSWCLSSPWSLSTRQFLLQSLASALLAQ